jgi:hypothetical protein
MRNILNEGDKTALLTRLSRVEPAAQRKWGTMNVHQMLVHLADPFRTALGDRPVAPLPGILSKFPVNKFVSQWAPWPKGAPTAAGFIPGKQGSSPVEFSQDKQALLSLIHRFTTHDPSVQFQLHPVFGKLTNRQWARVMWRHVDHHLRQFGC